LVELCCREYDVAGSPHARAEDRAVPGPGLGCRPGDDAVRGTVPIPYPQCMMLLTRAARLSGSSRWKRPSNTRLPTCAGAGACSQVWMSAENSHRPTSLLPPPLRYSAYNSASMARVPIVPATNPRVMAPSGVSRSRFIILLLRTLCESPSISGSPGCACVAPG
jgi:hypothetical protein